MLNWFEYEIEKKKGLQCKDSDGGKGFKLFIDGGKSLSMRYFQSIPIIYSLISPLLKSKFPCNIINQFFKNFYYFMKSENWIYLPWLWNYHQNNIIKYKAYQIVIIVNRYLKLFIILKRLINIPIKIILFFWILQLKRVVE